MSIKKLISESISKNPIGVKEAFAELISEKVRCACEKKIENHLEEGIKDGYYVSNSMKVIHDKPFKDSKSAIRHADTHENKTGRIHHVTKVKDGKVEKQWAYNGGHAEGGWEHYSDYKGDDAHHHLLGLHKNSMNESTKYSYNSSSNMGPGYRRTDGLKVGDKVRAHGDYPVNTHGIVKDIHPHVVKVRWNGAQHDATVPHRNVQKLDEEMDLSEALESGDYSLKKTGEKNPTIAHPNGKDIFHIYHKGEKIGSVEPYSGYKETRKPGSRIVSSRKDVTHYVVRFDKDKGPRSGNGNDQISVRTSHGHALPAHALETAVREHSWWKKNLKEEILQEDNDDYFMKKIHKDYKGYKNTPTSDILRMHKGQRRISGEYSAADAGGKVGMISSLLRNKHGDKKVEKYFNLSAKERRALDESYDQLDEISKAEGRNLAYHEKQAVRAAEKANVGALSRSEKEAWVDDYIAKNFIPKGSVGSAIYSGVMKVRPQKG